MKIMCILLVLRDFLNMIPGPKKPTASTYEAALGSAGDVAEQVLLSSSLTPSPLSWNCSRQHACQPSDRTN